MYFFFCFQPEQKSYTIQRGSTDPIYIHFRLTVPFDCKFYNGNTTKCALPVELASADYSSCSQGIYILERCGKTVEQSEWYTRQSIAVRHKDDINRRTSETFEIYLKSNVKKGGYLYWDEVKVPKITVSIFFIDVMNRYFVRNHLVIFLCIMQVNVHEKPSVWKKARCYAQSDPHMNSFMGK